MWSGSAYHAQYVEHTAGFEPTPSGWKTEILNRCTKGAETKKATPKQCIYINSVALQSHFHTGQNKFISLTGIVKSGDFLARMYLSVALNSSTFSSL